MYWNQDTYRKALQFVALSHAAQKIPGTQLPYLTHIANVVMEVQLALVHTVSHSMDADFAIQCACLHDVIEDTSITFNDIEKEFGLRVAEGVLALTKNTNFPLETQMDDSLERILMQSEEVRLVKMADRVDNLYQPPHFWTLAKRQAYRMEAFKILEKLGGVNRYIENRLQERIEDYLVFL